MIAYGTDLEGRWDKLETFVDGNPWVSLEDGALRLAEGATFVFGGDAIDRGPHGRRIIALMLAARRRYGERVVLLAGNRDINKLRLVRELDGAPPARAPEAVRASRATLLEWILAHTMGAKDAFAHRAAELAAEGRPADGESVAQSFLDDVAPGGELAAYLAECRLFFRAGPTLFVHGAVTAENLGVTPGRAARIDDVDDWGEALNAFYEEQLRQFAAGREPTELIAYQAPIRGTRANQASVVYARPTDAYGNPISPGADVAERLVRAGIRRVVVGHTPSGDCPAFVRTRGLELILADNSYGRVEIGSQLSIDAETTHVRGRTELDGGERRDVSFTASLSDRRSPLGLRVARGGALVKAELAPDEYLLFRAGPEYRVEQTAAPAAELRERHLHSETRSQVRPTSISFPPVRPPR